MSKLLYLFMDEESGQGMVEYGLIVALVAAALIFVITAFGQSLNVLIDNSATQFNDAVS